jgi:predicted MFS family arabinose efflux permease
MKEHYVPKRKSFFKSVKDSFKTSSKGLKFVIHNKKLLILIAAGLFFSLMSVANNGWQPLLVEFSLPEYSLGIVYSILGIFTIISSIISKYLTTKIKILLPIFIVMKMVLAFGLLLVIPPYFLGAVMIFIVYTGMLDVITMPSLSVYFHKISKKHIRATLVSIKSMVGALIVAIFSIFAGLMMDNIGIKYTIILSSLFGIIAIFFFIRVKD